MHRFLLRSGFAVAFAAGCVEQTPDMPSEEDIKAAQAHILTTPPTVQHPNHAELEDKLTYLGCDVDTETVVPGKSFNMTHYWQVNNPLTDDWKLFVHLEAPDTKKAHLNADHVPIAGKYPVRIWKKGEIIRDIQKMTVPQSWPSNGLEVYVGLWKGPQRLKVVKGPNDGENRVLSVKLPVDRGGEQERKSLVARRVKPGTIKIDGKIDEAVWAQAGSTGSFVHTMDGTPTNQRTEAKVLWDDKNLYVAFQMEDKDIWTTLVKHDDKLWREEVVELFINADKNSKKYVELQVNPKNVTFDSYLPDYRANQNDWDSGMKTAVKVDGTVDNRSDVDKGWVVEVALPLDAARGKDKEMRNVPPAVGTEWRMNFFRLDVPKEHASEASSWSPPMVGDFHALERFGTVIFGDEKGVVPAKANAVKAADRIAPQATKIGLKGIARPR